MTDQGGLLVPVRDIDGRLHSLQYITRVSKAFLKNSHKSGCMHVIDPNRYLGKGSYGNVGQMTQCSNTACRKVQTPVVLNPEHQAKALKRFGGARRDRTDDLLLAKPLKPIAFPLKFLKYHRFFYQREQHSEPV